VRKVVWFTCVGWLCGLLAAAAAESFTLADGTTVGGDIVSATENGVIFRMEGDKYTERVPWIRFSQASLRQLAQTPKIEPLVQPFIEPPASERPAKPEVKIQEVRRLDRSGRASLFGGLFATPLGLVILMLLYAGNLYAGYEVAVFRARPMGLVMGVSAALPVIGPIIFLAMPGLRVSAAPEEAVEAPAEEAPAESQPHKFVVPSAAPSEPQPHKYVVPGVNPPEEEIRIAAGSWQDGAPAPPPSQNPPEVFQRGQYMFNRRFFETKLAGFFGIVRREGDINKVMLMKTPRTLYVVERISRIAANDLHIEILRGDARVEVMVPFSEIQEIQLKNKNP
jgi:hypothetical protein